MYQNETLWPLSEIRGQAEIGENGLSSSSFTIVYHGYFHFSHLPCPSKSPLNYPLFYCVL